MFVILRHYVPQKDNSINFNLTRGAIKKESTIGKKRLLSSPKSSKHTGFATLDKDEVSWN